MKLDVGASEEAEAEGSLAPQAVFTPVSSGLLLPHKSREQQKMTSEPNFLIMEIDVIKG